MKKLLIVIPALNEEKVIASTVKDARSIRVKGFSKPEVIIVNDGSKDSTAAIAKESGAMVLDHIIQLGAGGGTRTGLKYALRICEDDSVIVTMDADGQHHHKDVIKLVDALSKGSVDMVIGNRIQKGDLNMPWYRKVGNNSLTNLSRFLFGIKVKDTQSGMRAYKPSSLAKIVDYQSDKYAFCTEMLWLAKRENLKVGEVPITVIYSDYSLSKGQSNWNAFNLILELLWMKVSR